MSNGTKIHNEICRRFKSKEYSKSFLQIYTQDGCKKTNKIILEDIVSNNNYLIGYCDVVIDYEDNGGRQQKALIEIKSSADAINKDSNDVLRQIKKYRFYNKSITKVFLVYSSDASGQPIENTNLFSDEDIFVVDINKFVDSEKIEQGINEFVDSEEFEQGIERRLLAPEDNNSFETNGNYQKNKHIFVKNGLFSSTGYKVSEKDLKAHKKANRKNFLKKILFNRSF
jgi:hypothetical protein